ncbi:nucleotidyl transferase AbiEii/AbiGii toxin family protein [Chitinophaga nivalis]|uniref:Nucleotidyl transferase AbiEii/AbiGii toxin family protein n=1 Tax=Chitinophaga nivalis TaxID=2991709 RepID=A0ABT3IG56_9BACT|nr:nucleotidyl transferase AbiEii/AbiGii toxin family protein [Chitinophaga nivalis]MCW3467370.1 nucleotidyl transferase AbiEii/AbiGii toxin family protein [Chitinophaga nivalis]MCW3482938.1 nucleotidyl transferase AbiEii/AbiGii toxin family protein [Chitinophaga nivalis]
MEETYRKQVSLLLTVLPEVAKEKCFALHGGTAINLFVRDMPRLSVDIDLTYLLIEDRSNSLTHIAEALERIKANIEKVLPNAKVSHREDNAKLQISANKVDIKLEVNLVNRGSLSEPVEMELCVKAQNDFEAFCIMPVVPIGQLFGGKIIAALDRQHPRDLFDVKHLLEIEGFTQEIKEGFLHYLLCSDRPINEIITPNFQGQRAVMENQFTGMTDEVFDYTEFEDVRKKLVQTIHANLTNSDKAFLLSVKNATPDWEIYDFEKFPAVRWKLQNLQNLKDKNPKKHRELYEALEKKLMIPME